LAPIEFGESFVDCPEVVVGRFIFAGAPCFYLTSRLFENFDILVGPIGHALKQFFGFRAHKADYITHDLGSPRLANFAQPFYTLTNPDWIAISSPPGTSGLSALRKVYG
jgi:hypothetical protein